MADVLGAALATSKTIIDVLQLTPCGPLQVAFSAFSYTLQLVQDVNSQRDQALALVRLIAEILLCVDTKIKSSTRAGGVIPQPMIDNIGRFERRVHFFCIIGLLVRSPPLSTCRCLNAIQVDFEKLIAYNFMKRLLRKDQTANTLTKHHQYLMTNLQLFGVSGDSFAYAVNHSTSCVYR